MVDASPINPPSTTSLLRKFREQWQNELSSVDASKENSVVVHQHENQTSSVVPLTDEERASAFFKDGTQLEQLGKVFEAMHLYRRAVQLVPDIEQRMYDQTQKQLKEEIRLKSDNF